MKLTEETITVFNPRMDESTGYDYYEPTVIKGVSWYSHIISNVDSSGLNASNAYTIRIPADADFDGKAYADPSNYPECNPDMTFTLSQGSIIVKGDERNRMKPSELKEKYGEFVTILGVTDNRRAPNAKHWRVIGK